MKKTFLLWATFLALLCIPAHAQVRLHAAQTPFTSTNAMRGLPIFGAIPSGLISSNGAVPTTWQVGYPVGQIWNVNTGAFEARDITNTSFAIVRGATPANANDLVTKAYADGHVAGSVLTAPPGSGTTVLTDTSGTLSWAAPSGSGFTAGTDLSGTSTNQTVVGWQARALSATAPNAGNGYYWSGTTWVPSALNLAGGANFVTGVLPASNQAAQTLAGDASGLTSATTVTAIRNSTVPTLASGYLHFNGTNFVFDTPAAGTSFVAGTDLSGTATNQTVVGWQTRPVSASAPTAGNTYGWSGTTWVPGALNLAGGAAFVTGALPDANQAAQTLAGDATGTTAAVTVGKILNTTVPTLASGYLHYNGTNFVWDTPSSGGPGVTWANDLAGSTNTTQTVVGIQSRPVSGSAPSAGNGYYWSGTTWVPSALNLAGGAGAITGLLPTANQAAQVLAGDVTGPTSATLLNTVNTNVGTFGGASTVPTITVNGKGLITAVTTNAVVASATTLTGIVPVANGGTGLGTAGSNGQIFTTVGSTPTWTNPQAVTTTLVFQPGGTPTTNVFTSWAALYSAASSVTGSLTVFFDGTFSSNAATIPAGTYAFTQPEVIFKCAETGSGGFVTATVVVTTATGATISGVTRYENLVMTNGGTAPVTSFSGSIVTTLSAKRTVFHGSGTAPYFALTGTAHLYMMSELAGIGDGTNVAVSVGSTAFFNPLLFNGGFVQVNAISGSTGTALGSTNVGVAIYGAGLCEQTGVAVYYIGSTPDTFSWQPGQPATNYGNQFADWATLAAAVNNAAGSSNITISFDCSATGGVCTIPAGTWAFTKGSVTFDGGIQPISFSGVRHVTLADGAHLTGVRRFRNLFLDTTATTSSPMTVTNEVWDIHACVFQASGSKALIAGTTSQTSVLLFSDSATSIVGDGTHQVVDSTASGSLIQVTARQTNINANALSAGTTVTSANNSLNNSGVPSNLTSVSPPVFVFNTSVLGSIRNVGVYFSNWGDLVAAANILSLQPIEVFFNGNATIPAGTWAFTNPKVTFDGQPPNISTATIVQMANGATLSGVTDVGTIVLQSQSASPVMTFSSGSGGLFHMHFGAQIEGSSTAPFFASTGTGNLSIFMEANSLLGGNGFAAASTVGSSAVIGFFMKDLTKLDTGSVSGPVPANLGVLMEGASPVNSVPSVTTTVYEALSKQTVYDDTVVPSPSLGVTVQAAIDALKGRVVNTLPSPGSNGQVLTVVSGSAAWATPSGGAGITQLTNDVTAGPGSGSVPAQVNSASGTAPFAFTPSLFRWVQASLNPTITQVAAAAGTSGQALFIQAQNGGSGSTTGGTVEVVGGTGGSAAGSAALLAGDSSYGVAATPTGISFGGTAGSRVSWTNAIVNPFVTQDDLTTDVAPSALRVQAQNSHGPSNNVGGELLLLGGTGAGGSSGILAGTPDGLNYVAANSIGVDVLSAHNYRFGNFGATFPTGTGVIVIKDDTASPTSQIPGGMGFESKSGALEVNASGIEFPPFASTPFLIQERAGAGVSGTTMQIAAQPGGTGNTNGGNLSLQSGPGAGTGLDGTIQLTTGNGSNAVVLLPSVGGGQSHFSFVSGVAFPYFTQESPFSTVNGQDLVVRAQTGGPGGATNGGNTIIEAGIQGPSGTGIHGSVEIRTPDFSNFIVVPPQNFAASPANTTPIVGVEGVLGAVNALNYSPAITASSANKVTQVLNELKHVDVCHLVKPISSSGTCELIVPMHVQAMMTMRMVTMCRVTTGASGTSTNDTVTTKSDVDWINTTGSGAGAPTIVGPGNYNATANGTPDLAVITYAFAGGSGVGGGTAGILYTVSTTNGRNLGTLDCTTYTTEDYN